MRKRSSDSRWFLSCQILAILGLFGILTLCLRVPTLSWAYGQVSSQLPIVPVSVPSSDSAVRHAIEHSTITKHTPAVILSTESFYLGTVESFTKDFANTKNKYLVPHQEGKPQLSELFGTMVRWYRNLAKQGDYDRSVVLLMPEKDVPLPIVIQVLHWMNESKLHDQVVLGSALL